MPLKPLNPKTQEFSTLMPVETHRIAATCEEVDCLHYLEGWITPVSTDSIQAHYIRNDSGREFREQRREGESKIVEFVFAPGQRCFRQHDRLSGRPPIYIHATSEGRRVHKKPEDFMEHAHEEIKKNVGLED